LIRYLLFREDDVYFIPETDVMASRVTFSGGLGSVSEIVAILFERMWWSITSIGSEYQSAPHSRNCWPGVRDFR